jgi:hypothetical protein
VRSEQKWKRLRWALSSRRYTNMTNHIKEYQGFYPEETRMDYLKSQISRLCPLKSCMLLSIPTQASSICGRAESAKANFSEFMSKFEDYSKRERPSATATCDNEDHSNNKTQSKSLYIWPMKRQLLPQVGKVLSLQPSTPRRGL